MRFSQEAFRDEAIVIDSLLTPIVGRGVARLGALYVSMSSLEQEE